MCFARCSPGTLVQAVYHVWKTLGSNKESHKNVFQMSVSEECADSKVYMIWSCLTPMPIIFRPEFHKGTLFSRAAVPARLLLPCHGCHSLPLLYLFSLDTVQKIPSVEEFVSLSQQDPTSPVPASIICCIPSIAIYQCHSRPNMK